MMHPSTRQKQAVCDRFNASFAVGDTIRVWTGPREDEPVVRKVRHPAVVLSGHTPVVYVEGGGGCVALTHVEGFVP